MISVAIVVKRQWNDPPALRLPIAKHCFPSFLRILPELRSTIVHLLRTFFFRSRGFLTRSGVRESEGIGIFSFFEFSNFMIFVSLNLQIYSENYFSYLFLKTF